MQSATRGIFFVLAFILFIFGVIDIAEQMKAGEDIHWRMPIILIGFGAGIPIVLFSYPDMFSTEHEGDISSGNHDDYGSSGGGDGGGD